MDANAWAPDEHDITGYTVKGTWVGAIDASFRMVTALIVTNGVEDRIVYFDIHTKRLRSRVAP